MPATPAWPPKSAPRLFVAQPLHACAELHLDGAQAHYLARVMRARPGDAVIACDDATGEYLCTVAAADRHGVALRVDTRLRAREAVPDFTLCAALLKKPRFDLLLEKATELGVAAIQPVLTRRGVADALNLDRARAIVTEAAEQCARTALPRVAAPVPLAELLRGDRLLFFADEAGGDPAAAAFAAQPGPAALLTGPEGGFDDAERALIRAHAGTRAISLGPLILRAETAAIAATALWMGIAGDWCGAAKISGAASAATVPPPR